MQIYIANYWSMKRIKKNDNITKFRYTNHYFKKRKKGKTPISREEK